MSNQRSDLDPSKVNQLFQKIERIDNLEIEQRSLKNLAQKVALGLIDAKQLALGHVNQIGTLLAWINRRQTQASPAAILNTVQIFQALSQTPAGKNVLLELGADSFLFEFNKSTQEETLSNALQVTLYNLVNEGPPMTQKIDLNLSTQNPSANLTAAGGTDPVSQSFDSKAQSQNPFATQIGGLTPQNISGQQEQNLENQHETQQNNETIVNNGDTTRLQEQSFMNSSLQQAANIKNQSTSFGFNRANFSIQRSTLQQSFAQNPNNLQQQEQTRDQQTDLEASFARAAGNQTLNQTNQLVSTMNQGSRTSSYTQIQAPNNQNNSQLHQSSMQSFQSQNQNPLHTTQMEMLHKQQILKESCEIPFVNLSEEDEKKIFDLSVQLKFGDFRTVLMAVNTLVDEIVPDFPIEVLLQRSDIFKSLLDLLEGGQSGVNGQSTNETFTNLAYQALTAIVKRLSLTYKFIGSNLTRPSRVSSVNYAGQFAQKTCTEYQQFEAEEQQRHALEYLKQSYPGLSDAAWNTRENMSDLRKYGAHMPTDRLVAASIQGSLSCRAALGLILTKTIYLLKDTEKLGLYVQLIKTTLDVMMQMYRVESNPEFTELIHLCLIAFDSVCEFYKDQIFEEILIEPILALIVKFLDLLNSIPSSCSTDRYKHPFSETLFKNTKNLQMTQRRALFSLSQPEDFNRAMLAFFERIEQDLPTVNVLQKNVTKSFARATECYEKFLRVHGYRLEGSACQVHGQKANNFEDTTFVDTLPQLKSALAILEDLQHCIEMKIDFPFEHLLLDSCVFSQLLCLQRERIDPTDESLLSQSESLLITYLSLPFEEVRERILRQIYQRLKVVQQFQQTQTSHYANNAMFLARVIYRKKVINQLVNGMLINQEVANEESKLQMPTGQVIIRILIQAYEEGGATTVRQNGLNQFLLTFQSLLPLYPSLIGLIDLIEGSIDRNCRFLRLLRDQFSNEASKREFATATLSKSMSRDYDPQNENGKDLLASIINLKQPSADLYEDLDLVNLSVDYSNFDIQNIVSILQSVKSDFSIKKSSLEQLTMLLFDCEKKRGKVLFSMQAHGGVTDVFSFCLAEILTNTRTIKTYLNECVGDLEPDRIAFLDQCVRFVFIAYVFYQEEQVVKDCFDNIRAYSQPKKQKSDEKVDQMEILLSSLVFLCGSQTTRKNSLRLLYATVFHPMWLKVLIKKEQAHQWRTKRLVTMLVPDFAQETFVMLFPYQAQVVKMPQRNDLVLSQEQKHFITAMFNQESKEGAQRQILAQVSNHFVQVKTAAGNQARQDINFNQVMMSFETLQNYVCALSDPNELLLSGEVLLALQDLLRMLPTTDSDFNFLADFLMALSQLLGVASSFRRGEKQIESLVASLTEALKFHLLPYLLEIGLSGLEECLSETHSARVHFLSELTEFLLRLAQVDHTLKIYHHTPSKFQERVLSSQFVKYFVQLYHFVKDRNGMRKKIQGLFAFIVQNYDTSQLAMDQLPDLLVEQVSIHKLDLSFQGNSLVIQSIRTLLIIFQKRLTHVDIHSAVVRGNSDLAETRSLSHTAQKHIQKFATSGWLIRFTESKDARLRVLAWDLLLEVFDYDFFVKNASLCQTALNVLLTDGELYCVKISALKFLNKLSDSLIYNCEATQEVNDQMHDHLQDSRFVGSDTEHLTVKTMLNSVNRIGLVSKLQGVFSRRDCPLQMISLLLRLLSKLIQMDFKRTLPTLTQLDYWTILVDLIDVNALANQEQQESRAVLGEIKQKQLRDEPFVYDQVYVTLNSIIEFLFEAFKKESQLASLLVKTTKLLPSIFELMQTTFDRVQSLFEIDPSPQNKLPIRNRGLMTIFIDKITKILHICLLHPREYSTTLISKFLCERSLEDTNSETPRNWLYILKMFKLIGSPHSNYFSGHIDVKLAICRFIAELLIRMPLSDQKEHFLDETVDLFSALSYMDRGKVIEDEQEISTFGGLMLMEFGHVFKALYVDMRSEREVTGLPRETEDRENSRLDICMCINILTAVSMAAKTQAVEQNLLKKVIDICTENVQALYLSELERFTQKRGPKNTHAQQVGKNSKQIFEAQFNRKFKYARLDDLDLCEREVLRMLALVRHLFYHSEFLLVDLISEGSNARRYAPEKSFVQQNAQTHVNSRVSSKKAEGSLGEKLLTLFASIIEQLGSNAKFTPLIEEVLKTLTTIASQNVKFKNMFLLQLSSVATSRKNSLLKLLVDRVMNLNRQGNTSEMRLIFATFKSLAMSGEVAKEINKQRVIDEMHTQLQIVCKNEKDIKLLKHYLVHYQGFLAAYASTDEGQKIILKQKPVFETSLFLLDTVTPPSVANATTNTSVTNQEVACQPELTPLSALLVHTLLFLRNASYNRTTKAHFLSDPAFLPCLLAFVSSKQQHPRVRAYSAACLWSVLFNHQGVKAAINSPTVRSELSLLANEFQRQTDIATYAEYVTHRKDVGAPEPSQNSMLARRAEKEQSANARMADFTLLALRGVIGLLES